MRSTRGNAGRKRGRPPKFGRPSEVVALTLPEEVVSGLRDLHPDLAWAVVRLFEDKRPRNGARAVAPQPDAELVRIGGRQSLIVVHVGVFKKLPGISIIPLSGTRAFLALEPGRGMADLELAVLDRIDDPTSDGRERRALKSLRALLLRWRHDQALRFHTRAIIVVERVHERAAR
jgi:hypothetical protein